MTMSLYDATVPSFLQALTGVAGFLEKGRVHLTEKGVDLQEIVDTRLYPDMLPFWFQISSVAHHTQDAIEGVRAGAFAPGGAQPPLTYADLQKLVAAAAAALKALSPAEVNAMAGKDVIFSVGERKMPFTAEGFLLSFSIPNLHFHATTAYDILRMKGVPLGKRDYLGGMRLKT
jgi:uncharacterized protein